MKRGLGGKMRWGFGRSGLKAVMNAKDEDEGDGEVGRRSDIGAGPRWWRLGGAYHINWVITTSVISCRKYISC